MYDDYEDDSPDVLDSEDNDTSEKGRDKSKTLTGTGVRDRRIEQTKSSTTDKKEGLQDKSRTTPTAGMKLQKVVKEKDTKDEKSKTEGKGLTALIAPSDYENIYSNKGEQVTPKAILKSTRSLEPKSLRKRVQILTKNIRKETNKEVQFPEDF